LKYVHGKSSAQDFFLTINLSHGVNIKELNINEEFVHYGQNKAYKGIQDERGPMVALPVPTPLINEQCTIIN
jgi:hypothetical protein